MSLTYCDGAASSTAAPTASAMLPGPASSAIFFVYVPPRLGWRLGVVWYCARGLIYGLLGVPCLVCSQFRAVRAGTAHTSCSLMNKTTKGPRARKMAQRCLAGKARPGALFASILLDASIED